VEPAKDMDVTHNAFASHCTANLNLKIIQAPINHV